jgi:hypothetical protein
VHVGRHAPRPLRPRDLGREALEQRPERGAPHAVEARVAPVRRVVADQQHGPVGVPVRQEGVDHGPRPDQALAAAPDAVDALHDRGHLRGRPLREGDCRVLDVDEVVVEGAGAGARLARDRRHGHAQYAVLVQAGGRGVEQAVARAEGARAEAPAGARELGARQIERSRPAQ